LSETEPLTERKTAPGASSDAAFPLGYSGATDQVFPKSARLLKRREFRQVYETGTPYRNTGFHVFVLRRAESAAPTRIGLTATRGLGNSVQRNRVRRSGRECFRLLRPHLKSGFDLVVNFHRRLAGASHSEFCRLFQDVLGKAHLLESSETGR